MNPIKQRRKAKGWTLARLASYARVTRGAVHYWEVKGSVPRAQNLRRLAKVFEVNQLDLINELLDWQSAHRRS